MTICHPASSLSSPASEVEINHPTVVSREGTWYPLLMEQKHDNLIQLGGCQCCPCSWGFWNRSRKKGRTPCLLEIGLLQRRERAHFETTIPCLGLWNLRIYACVHDNFITCRGNRAKWCSGGSLASESLTSPLHGVECVKIWATNHISCQHLIGCTLWITYSFIFAKIDWL